MHHELLFQFIWGTFVFGVSEPEPFPDGLILKPCFVAITTCKGVVFNIQEMLEGEVKMKLSFLEKNKIGNFIKCGLFRGLNLSYEKTFILGLFIYYY